MLSDEPYLLAAVQSEIFLLDLRSSSLELLSSGAQPVLSLDYDWKEQKVYWVNAEAVVWTTLDQRNRGTLIKGAFYHLRSA